MIPIGSRCCNRHLNEIRLFKEESLYELKVCSKSIDMKNEKKESLFNSLRTCCNRASIFEQFREFSFLTDDLCGQTTGFSKEEFCFIYNIIAFNFDAQF